MILELNRVNAFYGKGQVLFNLSLGIEEGDIVAVLGRNGVGKSTMMKSIMGIMCSRNKASLNGKIIFKGNEIDGLSTARIAAKGIAYVPQGRRIFSTLTTKENLLLAQRKGEKGYWTLERIYELFPVLKDRSAILGTRLSGGEQQMLAVARGLMQNPELLLLDEITEGLAPIVVNELEKVIHELSKQGVSILLAEQNAAFALHCSNNCYFIEKGAVVHYSPSAEVKKQTLSTYLGT